MNRADALAQLQKIRASAIFPTFAKKEEDPKAKKKKPVSVSFVRFSTKDQALFAKRLSFLTKAGVPIVECLTLLRSQTKSKGRQKVFDSVIADVSSGQHLATSLGKFNRIFGDFTINLIKVGENSGGLSQNLAYLAEELQKKQALQRKVIGALVYPVFITIATVGLTAMLTAYIFPKLMPIFTSLHVDLPLTTRVLIATSDYLRHWGLWTLLGLVVFFIALGVWRSKSEAFRMFGDKALLKIPFAGNIAQAYNLTNFCRTLGLLLKSGIRLTSALEVTAETIKNRAYRKAVLEIFERVTRGESISIGLALYPKLFPDILTHMITIGERTGSLSATLLYLGELYEAEVDDLTKALSSSIEPVLMVIMGLLVGTLAVSVITPIYSITQHLNPK